jgi:integrase
LIHRSDDDIVVDEMGHQMASRLDKEVLGLDLGEIDVPPRARMPSRVPVVLTPGEVRTVIEALLDGVPRLVAMLLYGAGLRLQECLELRVKDVDLSAARLQFVVARGRRIDG